MFDVDDEYKFVFTSMRYDDAIKKDSRNPTCPQCPESKAVYLIKYHYDRLVKSAHNQGWFDIEKKYKDPTALFQRCQNAVMAHQRKTGNKCPFKVSVDFPDFPVQTLSASGFCDIVTCSDRRPESQPQRVSETILRIPGTVSSRPYHHDRFYSRTCWL